MSEIKGSPPDPLPGSSDKPEHSRLEVAAEEHTSTAFDAAIPVLEETFGISKRRVVKGTVKVSTHTESYEDVARVMLEHDVVDVVRVPIGQLVETAPAVRREGGTTIVPLIEERFVVVKQLFLVEELHIRHRVAQRETSLPVTLRRQTAIVERLDTTDQTISPGD